MGPVCRWAHSRCEAPLHAGCVCTRQSALSSIINNGSRTICIYNNKVVMLRVAPYQDVWYVGDTKNDRADYWKSFAGSVSCPLT